MTKNAYSSAKVAAYDAGAAAGYKQAEARIKELEAALEDTSVEVHTYIKQLLEAEDRLEAVKELCRGVSHDDDDRTPCRGCLAQDVLRAAGVKP